MLSRSISRREREILLEVWQSRVIASARGVRRDKASTCTFLFLAYRTLSDRPRVGWVVFPMLPFISCKPRSFVLDDHDRSYQSSRFTLGTHGMSQFSRVGFSFRNSFSLESMAFFVHASLTLVAIFAAILGQNTSNLSITDGRENLLKDFQSRL